MVGANDKGRTTEEGTQYLHLGFHWSYVPHSFLGHDNALGLGAVLRSQTLCFVGIVNLGAHVLCLVGEH